MNSKPHLMRAADYARVIRPLLPDKAFAPCASHLWRITAHSMVVFGGYLLVREANAWLQGLLCSLLIGHSLGCLAFLAHDLSHHSITRSKALRRILELVLWGLNLISPTMWKRIHNQTHHQETNTLNDPDRQFRRQEASAWSWAYNRLLYPSRETVHGNPLPLFHFVSYILRHLITSLLPGAWKLPIVTHKPDYSARQRIGIITDLMVIAAIQMGVWYLVGGEWSAFVWASPVAVLWSSSLVMLYVFTNHFLNPLCEHTDPLVGSTSVIVPKWMDWLHDNFSYHTEHHVFPGMNPRWYPLVSELLQQHFPERYNRLPLAEAWSRLWRRGEFIEEPQMLTPTDETVTAD